MAFDSDREQLIVYGGFCDFNVDCPASGGDAIDETYVYDVAAKTWTLLPGPHPAGLLRYSAALVYMPTEHRALMFGGVAEDPVSAERLTPTDTWAFYGTWTKLPATGPAATEHPAADWDSDLERVVLFDSEGNTWLYGEGTWTPLTITGPAPGPRIGAVLAYDTSRHRHLLVGGFSLDTVNEAIDAWELDAGAGVWTSLYIPGATPLPRRGFVLERHAHGRGYVLFGGSSGTSQPRGDAWMLKYKSAGVDEICGDDEDSDEDGQSDAIDPDCAF